jgi:hypothetical protein
MVQGLVPFSWLSRVYGPGFSADLPIIPFILKKAPQLLPQAIRLKESFMEVYKARGAAGLTAEKLKAAGIGWRDCFQEIPVSIQNSALVSALMAQVTVCHVRQIMGLFIYARQLRGVSDTSDKSGKAIIDSGLWAQGNPKVR